MDLVYGLRQPLFEGISLETPESKSAAIIIGCMALDTAMVLAILTGKTSTVTGRRRPVF